MKLVRIKRVVWDVLAIADRRERTVWDELREDPHPHARKMRALIQNIALHGPPHDQRKSKKLRDDIFEFRTGPKKGPKLRVFYFYDAGKMVICTHSVWKREAVPEEIDRAVAWKNRYLLARERGELEIAGRSRGEHGQNGG